MSQSTATKLTENDIESFLRQQTAGTLTLAKGDDAYAIPVAFTTVDDSNDIYFRLGYGPGSRKREYIDATDRATFVVSAETDAGWRSVIARGPIEHLSSVDGIDSTPRPGPESPQVSYADIELEIPFYSVFESPSEMTFALVRLRTSELTGVAED